MSNQIRIPAGQIVSGSYTSNGEYVYKGNTKKIYKGYYFKYKDKFYTGKTFDPSIATEELTPFKKVRYTSKDLLYDVLAGVKQGAITPINSSPVKNKSAVIASIQAANQQGFTPVVGVNPDSDIVSLNTASNEQVAASTITKKKRYFFRVVATPLPKLTYRFGEVKDEEQFNTLTKRPNHTTATVTETQVPGQNPVFDENELNAAEKKMPGLKVFLGIEAEQSTV
jgi:hypothetical protein